MGKMTPNSELLIKLSESLNVRLDYFFYDGESMRLENISFRKLSGFSLNKQEAVALKTCYYLERCIELEDIVGVKFPNVISKESLRLSGSSDLEVLSCIDSHVVKLRRKWGLGLGSLSNVVEILESKGVKVLLLDVELEFNGLSTWANKLTPVIVINTAHKHLDRLRFTALHELGHLVLDIRNYSEKDQEHYCNYFASSMLIPDKTLRDELGEKRREIEFLELGLVKIQYGISVQALLYRAKDLGIISKPYFQQLYSQIRNFGWRKNEPFEYVGLEKSFKFDQLLLRAYAEGVISMSKAASLKNISLSEFRGQITPEVRDK